MNDPQIYKTLTNARKPRYIGIVDADLLDHGTRHPNLALMKISAFCKRNNHKTELITNTDNLDKYDWIFISKVFSFSKDNEKIMAFKNKEIGGTGFYSDGGKSLPDYVEHIMPDYELYKKWAKEQIDKGKRRSVVSDYLDFSIGFTSRGCFRKCEFCVNKKYKHAFKHSPVSEFLDNDRPGIYLWDDNFLACKDWKEILFDLIDTGKPFQFRQGLDIRLMTKEKAELLSSCRYHGDYIFAFDHIEDKKQIEEKLKLWRSVTKKGTRLYVLCAYDSQDAKDIKNTFERIRILMKYNCLPYIMRYESYKYSEYSTLYTTIARWCNQPQFFKKMSFRQFCEANQKYHKTKNTLCAAYSCMQKFANNYPNIAKKYFDLRYEEV